jgi:hypothetical protein
MKWRLFVIGSLWASTAFADWQRHAVIEGYEYTESAEPHPLAYFTRNPNLRTERGFCFRCTPQRLSDAAKRIEPKASVKLVGNLSGLAIYDVVYRFDEIEGSSSTKSILVKTSPNEYREIYFYAPAQSDAHADPSRILRVDGGDLLMTRYYCVGGNKGMYEDRYWRLEKEGLVAVDFGVVLTAAQAVLPANKRLWRGGDYNSPETISSSTFRFLVWDKDASLCCGDEVVEVRFKLDNSNIIVTAVHYEPTGNPSHGRKE